MKREIPENPPLIQEHHVRLPEQLADVLRATPAHLRGYTGKGIRVAVIDSGFFPHPYYVSRGYNIIPVPTAREKAPHVDEYGHGTAQLASLLAIAPDAEVLAIKCMDRDPSLALEKAISLKPKVLSCAWGFNIDHPAQDGLPRAYQRMQKLISDAILKEGISVVAAGGNGQHAFPGSMPHVIAAGGVYYSPDGNFHMSEISSRFESSFYPGRQVPDLCGVVGDRPHGRLLLVPVPPRAKLARRPGFATIAAGDSNDVSAGWAMFSGTSAATAMISGACALLYQANPGLGPIEVKRRLVEGARVVSSFGCRLLDVEAAFGTGDRASPSSDS